jgi:diguanylate cyclase (GGDEF)-like protein
MGAAVTSPLAACLLAYLLFGQVPSQTLLLWLGCQVFWALCSFGLSLMLVQRVESKLARRRLMGCLLLTLLLEGLTWGAAPLLLPTGQMAHTVLVVVFLCIMCSLALHVLCLNRPCMWAFMLGLMLPVAVNKLWVGGDGLDVSLVLGVGLVLGLSLFHGTASGRLWQKGINAAVQSALLSEQLKGNSADLRTALRAIRQMGTRDPLTQSYNRRAMLEYLEREMVSQDRGGSPLGLLLVDIDHFRDINDSHGHLTGDEVLKGLTQRLGKLMRGNDFLARYGGEEFVCLVHVSDAAQLAQAAERIRASVAAAPILSRPEVVAITVSVGATLRRSAEQGAALFARADRALRRAKAGGYNKVMVDVLPEEVSAPLDITLESPQ